MFHFVVTLSVLLVAAFPSTATADRNDQWLLRSDLGDGKLRATAVFLTWDYSAVLFRATCDAARGELVLRYYGDGEVPLTAQDALALRRTLSLPLVTEFANGYLEGRAKLSDELLSMLSSGSVELEIDAPNAMETPWYVGNAAALFRVAQSCR